MKIDGSLIQKDSSFDLAPQDKNKWYRRALILALVTIFYNLIEGFVAVWFGYNDETLALFGFGSGISLILIFNYTNFS